MPRITDTKIERELITMLEEAILSYREQPNNAYRMGRAHMITDIVNRLQGVDFYYSLDLDNQQTEVTQ